MLKAMDIRPLQIGQVARKTGLSVDAIRFYEKAGLVPRPARTQGGYRLYRQPEIADLEFIQKAQQLGFSLKEIRELFSIQRHPRETCVHVRDLIAQKLNGASLVFADKTARARFRAATVRERLHRQLWRYVLAVVRGKIGELQMLETALGASLKPCRKALRRNAEHRDSCPVLAQLAAARPPGKKA